MSSAGRSRCERPSPTLDGLRRKTNAAGIQVTIDVPDDLPTLAADPTGMRMVVDNLVRNAAHALAGTEGERRITVRARAGGAGIEIVVEDTGPGLSDEVVERLFEPFVTTKPLGEGTGLGLAIVHEIVAAHGGNVQADRAPGGGARFRVTSRTSSPAPVTHRLRAPAPPNPASARAARRTGTAPRPTSRPGGSASSSSTTRSNSSERCEESSTCSAAR